MKNFTGLYARVHGWSHLLRAWRKARKGKRGRPSVASFELNAAEHLLELQRLLREKRYRPGLYDSFYVHDPKRRLISAAHFRDRVVHHALCAVMEPIFERRFIHDSYANRRGKGTHAALKRAQLFARRYRYVLPFDVEQFFAAVDHRILLRIIERAIADPDLLWLVRLIVASGEGVLREEYSMRYFPGDDLFAVNRPRGLPIGNLTSQFWANVYLDPLDDFIKRRLRCRPYLRYVDDGLLFADSKKQLWQWRSAIIEFLESLRLTLHEAACQPRPVTEGIPFLGFIVFPHHRRLKRRKAVTFRRRLKRLLADYERGEIDREAVQASVRGWVNHARFAQTRGLRRRLFREHPPILFDRGDLP